MYWLLEPNSLQIMATARRACIDPSVAAKWESEQEDSLRVEARDGQLPRGMIIAGSTAEIQISGLLTKRPDFWSLLLGGGNTTYGTVRAALDHAASNPTIKDVVLSIDSPGGEVSGLFELLESISSFRASSGKKLRVRAEQAQSAAYAIAAAAGNIEAVGRGATFGSIGTACQFYVSDSVVTVTNTDSPNKRPDVTTPEGKAVVVAFLDQLNDEFVRAIAQGRGVDSKEVTENFGRGASMTAVTAKKLGLIDRIATTAPRAVPNKQGNRMTDEQDTRAADRREIDAAEKRGEAKEKDRVLAHITMGESCGDMSIAIEAIRAGSLMSLELQSRYMSAGLNRQDRTRRQTESNAAETALKGVDSATPVGTADLGDQVVTALRGDRSFVRA